MKERILVLAVLFLIGFAVDDYGQTGNKGVTIKKKPQPENRGQGCPAKSAGVVLKVTFDRSAKISAVEVEDSSGCTEFDQSAMSAAFGIEFEPQIKDGEAITVTKMILYKYARY